VRRLVDERARHHIRRFAGRERPGRRPVIGLPRGSRLIRSRVWLFYLRAGGYRSSAWQ